MVVRFADLEQEAMFFGRVIRVGQGNNRLAEADGSGFPNARGDLESLVHQVYF